MVDGIRCAAPALRTVGLAALILAACIASAPLNAEPYEDNPSASANDDDYAAGKIAIEKKNWPEAIKRLQQAALRDPDNADLHNYLGYSYRNLKQLDLSLKHYYRAIALNPRHRGAHEYIGEAFLMMGEIENAEHHLAALRNICLLPCDELGILEKAVKEHRAKSK
jgi:Flp pilus assembly protein TadD